MLNEDKLIPDLTSKESMLKSSYIIKNELYSVAKLFPTLLKFSKLYYELSEDATLPEDVRQCARILYELSVNCRTSHDFEDAEALNVTGETRLRAWAKK